MSTFKAKRIQRTIKRRLKKTRGLHIHQIRSIRKLPQKSVARRRKFFSAALLWLNALTRFDDFCRRFGVAVLLLALFCIGVANRHIDGKGPTFEVATVGCSISAADSTPAGEGDNQQLPSLPTEWQLLGGLFVANATGPRKRRRLKAEIARERQDLWDKTRKEVDAEVAAYHAKLPRSKAKGTGAVYARYSSRFQDSVVDQIREILNHALELKIFVAQEHVFFDLATRGHKKRRSGIDSLKQVLEKKKVGNLLLFATNRVYRKNYETMEFAETVHVSWGRRVIFTKQRIDSDDKKRWKQMLLFHAVFDECYSDSIRDNVQAAQVGLFHKRLVFGTLPLGYKGEPIPGEFTKRKRQRCRIVIDEEAAETVRQIFRWYVYELVPIDEIVRRLNEGDYPLPVRTTIGMWTHGSVVIHLKNARYRGAWEYGTRRPCICRTKTTCVSVRAMSRSPQSKSKNFGLLRTRFGSRPKSGWQMRRIMPAVSPKARPSGPPKFLTVLSFASSTTTSCIRVAQAEARWSARSAAGFPDQSGTCLLY